MTGAISTPTATPAFDEHADRFEPALRRRRARLEPALQRAVERGDRDAHSGRAVARQVGEHVAVARDEMVLGDDQHGVAKLREHLEATPRETELALDGLVRVGDTRDRDHLRLPGLPRQLFAQQRRCIALDENLGLEIEARGEAERLVRGARETVVGCKPGRIERPGRGLDVHNVGAWASLDGENAFRIYVHLPVEECFVLASDCRLAERVGAKPVDEAADEPHRADPAFSSLKPESEPEKSAVAAHAIEPIPIDLRDAQGVAVVALRIEEAAQEAAMIAPA